MPPKMAVTFHFSKMALPLNLAVVPLNTAHTETLTTQTIRVSKCY
jgi:hypothetical protein